MRVKELLKIKGSDVHSISPGSTVYDALKVMAKKEVGALVVLKKGKMVGIVSERDYARKVILKGKASREAVVKEIMTSPVIYTTPDEPIERCMALMTAKHIRHLPVLEDGKILGVISIGDLVKAIIAAQENWIRELENHVLTTTSIV